MRLIYNNVADTATSISANNTVAGAESNLKNNRKSSVHRAGTSVTYTLTWTSAQKINAVALPATNLVAGSSIQVRLYTEAADTTPHTANALPVAAAADRAIILPGNVLIPNYTHFSLGGATKTSVWFPSVTSSQTTKRMEILLTNPNPIDCSRIVCGEYWQPKRQVSRGITLGVQDNSEVSNTRSGDVYINTTYTRESLNFELQYFDDADRKQLLDIFRTWGSNGFIYVCVFPDVDTLTYPQGNSELMQTYSIYGRNTDLSLQYDIYSIYTAQLSIESW
jgi:hypothetical protein